MTKFDRNGFNTTDLVLNVMERVALALDLDLDNDDVANEIYYECSSLEDYPEDCGFGSSDAYSFIEGVRRVFNIPASR